MKSTTTIIALLAAALLTLGCEGRIAVNGSAGLDQFTPGSETTTNPATEPPPGTIMRPGDDPASTEEACKFIDPGETPMRRLTGAEYHNTVRDLFPFATIPQQSLSADERVSGFEANTISTVTELLAEQYQGAAEEIAPIVVAGLAAEIGEFNEANIRAFIETTGAKAYRRPLDTTEVDGLYALYEAGATEFDAETGAQMLIEGLLQSPTFLYRVEVGEDLADEVVPLTDFEVATRLSYFLWGTAPDDTLVNAAAADGLSIPSDVESHARRMLEDPRARTRINEVFAQWMRIDELDGVDNPDPAFTDEVKESMVNETRAFIDEVIWEGEGTLQELLTADYTFVDANTAALYGIAGRTALADNALERVDLPPGRKGILSHLGVLTMHGHGQAPVHRGKFVRDAFLCVSDGAPAPPVEIEPLPTFEGESMRSKAEKRMNANDEGCAGCHSMMDGVGLAFDNYDTLGRYRSQDEFGNALNGSAEVQYTKTSDGVVEGVSGLADLLAGSPEVTECMTVQFFRYAFARMNGASDACSLHIVSEALADNDGDIKEMFVAMARTDAFLYRRNLSTQ